MLKYSKLLICMAISGPILASAQVLKLNEDYLLQEARKGTPSLDQIEASFQRIAIDQGEEKEKYAPELFGQGSYSETNERALIQFAPVFSPIKQAQIGVRQNLTNGIDARAYVTTDQRSASLQSIGKLENGTTTTIGLTLQIDLWKNLLGRMSKAKLQTVTLEKKKAEIEKEIQTKTFYISIRRLYWSLVANQEALNISEELLKTAKKQASETAERFRSSVAEADEVARYNAQVASREGTLTFLKYQREKYYTQLKDLIPTLSSHQIGLDSYDLKQTLSEIMACTVVIGQEKSTPYQFTKYDEAISLLREVRSSQAIYNSRYADPDVKLFGTVKSTGVSLDQENANLYRGNYGGSWDDMTEQNRTGYEVGVLFTVPLGDAKDRTQRSKEIYDDKRLLATINSTDVQVINTHREFMRTINLLNEVIRSQKISAEELGKRLKGMRRKYEQARVSVTEVVQDQDALLNAELVTIDTQLQILNTFFDYLVIFPDTPCTFNRI